MILEILNILIIPLISLSIYSRRFNETITLNLSGISKYAAFAAADTTITYVVMKVAKILIDMEAAPESQLYTVAVTIVAIIVPFIYELYKKYFDIRCEISGKSNEKGNH